MSYEIHDPRAWRISKSGFTIRTGWGDEKTMIAAYPGAASPIDGPRFNKWLDDAQRICDLHNATLATPAPVSAGRVDEAARALVAKLEVVHNDTRYISVWQCWQMRFGNYSGPTYTAELTALTAALAAPSQENNND